MDAPEWLGDKAKEKWSELTAKYPSLHEPHVDALSLLCNAWEVYWRAAEDVRLNGVVFNTGNQLKKNPAADIVNEFSKTISRLSKSLGIEVVHNDKQDLRAPVSPLQRIIENR